MPRAPAKKAKSAVATRGPLGEFVARGMVMQGAARVFSDKGIRDASVEDILQASNISRRTFYRLFGSKEEVMVALYRLATDVFLEACKRAIREEKDPVRQLERCVDTFLLDYGGDTSRLTYVLGGDAQRHESLLHERRMEIHAALATMLAEGARAHLGKKIDPLLLRALLLALEGVTRLMLEEGDEGRNVKEAQIHRVKRVMMRMLTATLEGSGPRVTALPEA